jgi:hypothetical protein
MPELEQRLHALGGDLEWPETPGSGPRAARAAGAARVAPVRPLVIALAAAVVALVAALSVPQARSSILRFFHLGGVHRRAGGQAPRGAPDRAAAPRQPPSTCSGRADCSAGRVLLPEGDPPDGVYFDGRLGPRAINLLYGTPAHPRLLVEEFLTGGFGVVKKYLTVGAPIEVRLRRLAATGSGLPRGARGGDRPASAAARHQLVIWIRGPLTIRLEGDMTMDEALEIARSFVDACFSYKSGTHLGLIEMPAADVDSPENDRDRSHRAVARGRVSSAPGSRFSHAATLAARHDIDLHFAIDLLGLGCPPDVAFQILV